MNVDMTLTLNHRPDVDDDIKVRHRRFLDKQSELDIPPPWHILDEQEYYPSDITGDDIFSIIPLEKMYNNQFKVGDMIIYTIRDKIYLDDVASSDDKLLLDFNPKDINYNELIHEIFPKMVSAFECYLAEIYGDIGTMEEHNRLVELCRETGKDLGGRDGVYRFAPVSFFDHELCRRAFDLTPTQIVERLKDNVESVYEHEDGVIIIYSSEILTKEQLRSIDGELKPLLA